MSLIRAASLFIVLVLLSVSGAASELTVITLEETMDQVVLQCVAKGFSPDPKVEWRDSSGNILHGKEVQITERGGSYNIIVNMTVTKTDTYSCVVTQDEIKQQTKADTYVHISAPEQKCKSGPVDLVFLIDDSGSVGPKDFETMRKFMIDMLATLDIGLNATRVGVVLFSDQVHTEFSLKTHATLDSMVKGINQIKQLGGGTMTGLAIKHVMNSVFTVEEGDRPKVPNVLVIVTDGRPQDPVDEVAGEDIGIGIKILAVGVARANMESLKAMASPPVKDQAFLVKSFDLIHQFGPQFQDKLCAPEQKCKSGPVDLVFLIDDSGSVRPQDFETMRKFMINMLATLDIGLNATRVGVVQFSSQVHTEFSLKTHATLDSMVKGINQIKQLRGGTMTGLAIKHVMNSVFTIEEGDRPKVPNVLVIVTDGHPQDPVDEVAGEARGEGIKIFAVGVAGANMASLKSIASLSVENHAFLVKSFDLIHQFGPQFQDKLCVPEQKCKSGPVDLVFLIDGSGSVGPQHFENMRKFIINILATLDIGLNATRVGVVQFSDQVHTEFSLKTHATLDSMVKGINQIKHPGGGTMTGLAIKYVMNSVFTIEEGDRPKVPNVLVIVTDGESQDEVDEVAAQARGKGIKIFAVGVAESDIGSLIAMASPPIENHAFFVKSLDLIHQFGPQFQDKLCVPEQKCKSGPVDLVFLIDGSGSVGPKDFKNMRIFIINMLTTLDIGLNATRVGVVQFSSQARTEFSLKTHATLDSMVDGIYQIKQLGGGTMTGLAIKHVMNSVFTVEEGDQPKVPNVLVIVTDGRPQDPVDEVAGEARGEGIKIFAVGVAGANMASLKSMASPPVENHAFLVKSLDLIHQFGLQFQDKLCGAASELTVIILEETMDQVVLQCVAKGFSPEPKVEWRDSSGNILHGKEVQITERGGSYDIILNMTVTKTDNYSCVVTQEEIKQQTKADTYVHISGISGSVKTILRWTLLLLLLSLLLLLALWTRWKKSVNSTTEPDEPAEMIEFDVLYENLSADTAAQTEAAEEQEDMLERRGDEERGEESCEDAAEPQI